ncbi:MAG: hypothetical protein ABR915_22740 [Thermoguttaceae bacterium]
MRRAAWILMTFGALAMAQSVAMADHGRIEEVHHHGHHGYYYGGWGPVVRPPAIYVYPAPRIIVPTPVYPPVVYPPVYGPQGYYYYGYPGPAVQFQAGGVSLGVGL